jgi:hypothetical protein
MPTEFGRMIGRDQLYAATTRLTLKIVRPGLSDKERIARARQP